MKNITNPIKDFFNTAIYPIKKTPKTSLYEFTNTIINSLDAINLNSAFLDNLNVDSLREIGIINIQTSPRECKAHLYVVFTYLAPDLLDYETQLKVFCSFGIFPIECDVFIEARSFLPEETKKAKRIYKKRVKKIEDQLVNKVIVY